MADVTVAYMFRLNTGAAATGLTLADIDIWLTSQNRETGVDAVIWDGTQHPTAEMDNTGAYIRILTTGDLDTYNYYAAAEYTGATLLQTDYVQGAFGANNIPIGTAVEFTYTVVTPDPVNDPIEGVEVDISTDIAGNNVTWAGDTDTFGVARDDAGNLPRLDPGTYYLWRQRAGYTFTNPDTEVVA